MAQSAQSRSTGQILQHTAVVLAGMASIGLTVAAGTYIVNQIGGAGLPGVIGAEPRESTVPPPATGHTDRTEPAEPRIGSWGLAAESRQLPVTFAGAVAVPVPAGSAQYVITPENPASAPTSRPGRVGGRVTLSPDTYVGANLARTQPNSLTVTFDTNVLAALTSTGRTTGEADGVTEFRTDLDVHSGEVSLAMTDPLLGSHDVQIQRHAEPAPVPGEHPQQAGGGVTTAGTTPAETATPETATAEATLA